MATSSAHRCLDPGTTVVVGTIDAHGVPAVCRATAVSSADDLATLLVYLPVATSHQTIQNVAATKRLAVTVMHPAANSATQLKGTLVEVRLASDEEGGFIRRQFNAFGDVLDRLGVPRRLSRSLRTWPAFAVHMQVEQTFEQTPGPKAGRPLT
jgi:hypothetical protein